MKLTWRPNPDFRGTPGEYLVKFKGNSGGWVERRATEQEAHLIGMVESANAELKLSVRARRPDLARGLAIAINTIVLGDPRTDREETYLRDHFYRATGMRLVQGRGGKTYRVREAS